MCGRFTITADPETLQKTFADFYVPQQMSPHYNIAPTHPIAVIPNDGKKAVDFFVWGLIPSWAKDPSIGSRMINARGETLAEKPSFRTAYKRRRCLILATGFFEWQKLPGQSAKVPQYILLKSGEPFAFAGLWDQWFSPDGSEIKSATIITTQPNKLLEPIHNRMPVILPSAAYDRWLDQKETAPQALNDLLVPYPSELMTHYPVSTIVNSPYNDVPETVLPV